MSPFEKEAVEPTAESSAEEVGNETREQKVERFTLLLGDGKKHLLAGTYADASKSLSEACGLSDELYGAKATEGFDAYYYYGKSLMELARLEPGVFTAALEGVKEESAMEDPEIEEAKEEEKPKDDSMVEGGELSEEKREEVRELVEDALAENAEALEAGTLPKDDETTTGTASEEKSEKATDEDTAKDDKSSENERVEAGKEPEIVDRTTEADDAVDEEDKEGVNEGEDEGAGDAPVETVAADEGADDEEEPSNLQLAWEVLEVARLICIRNKSEDDSWKQKEIDVCMLLGEVLIDDEKFVEAVEELSSTLKLMEAHLTSDSRIIAEAHFQIGRAYGLMCEFSKASVSYGTAVTVLTSRIDNLKIQSEKEESEEQKKTVTNEIEELQQLIPDIQAKVDDSVGSAKSLAEKLANENAEGGKESTTVGFGGDKEKASSKSPVKEAVEINHLVRKSAKRDSEAVTDKDDDSAKKAKVDVETSA